MDERLAKALEHSHFQATMFSHRENIKLKYDNDLVYAINGGLFIANPAMISFIDCLVRRGEQQSVVVDSRDIPIRIDDLANFLDQLLNTYHQASNTFVSSYETLRKCRSVKAILDL